MQYTVVSLCLDHPLSRTSFYLEHLSISNISLSQTSFFLEHLSISNIFLSRTSFYLELFPWLFELFHQTHFNFISLSRATLFQFSLYLKYKFWSLCNYSFPILNFKRQILKQFEFSAHGSNKLNIFLNARH